MKKYTFGTFSDRIGSQAIRSRIRAYSAWYNPAWGGCIVIEVEANNSKEARRMAIDRRLAIERNPKEKS